MPCSILFRVLLSLVLSAVIGCERSSKRHSAGLRTFIVVSLAATTAAIMEVWLLGAGHDALWLGAAVTIGAAIISGYSILFSSKVQIFSFITLLGYDVYVKKLLIEKILDNITATEDKGGKSKDKKKK